LERFDIKISAKPFGFVIKIALAIIIGWRGFLFFHQSGLQLLQNQAINFLVKFVIL
jgi:hypothetical protein